jgi:hypothetical protein
MYFSCGRAVSGAVRGAAHDAIVLKADGPWRGPRERTPRQKLNAEKRSGWACLAGRLRAVYRVPVILAPGCPEALRSDARAANRGTVKGGAARVGALQACGHANPWRFLDRAAVAAWEKAASHVPAPSIRHGGHALCPPPWNHQTHSTMTTHRPDGTEKQAPRNPVDRSPRAQGSPPPQADEEHMELPHERDQSTENTSAEPDPRMKQAAKDLESGQVDTDMRVPPGLDAAQRQAYVPGAGGQRPGPPKDDASGPPERTGRSR